MSLCYEAVLSGPMKSTGFFQEYMENIFLSCVIAQVISVFFSLCHHFAMLVLSLSSEVVGMGLFERDL